MIGWARIGNGEKWHQVLSTSMLWDQPSCRVACDPETDRPYDVRHLMDYRWQPPSERQCNRPACQREVDP